MIVRINKRTNPYVQIDKRPLEDDRLSFKAKGVLAYLLSRPDSWKVRIPDLCNRASDGQKAIQSAMRELKQFGYAKLQTVKSETGEFGGTEWLIFETPENSSGEACFGSLRFQESPVSGVSQKDLLVIKNGTDNDLKEEGSDSVESPPPKKKPAPNPEHARFIDLWCKAYKAKFGSEYNFAPNAGRNGKAVKEFLASGWTPERTVEVAWAAWGMKDDKVCWHCCHRSQEIYSFVQSINLIQVELKKAADPETFLDDQAQRPGETGAQYAIRISG